MRSWRGRTLSLFCLPRRGAEEIEEDEEEEDQFINNSPEQLDNVTFQGGLLFDEITSKYCRRLK